MRMFDRMVTFVMVMYVTVMLTLMLSLAFVGCADSGQPLVKEGQEGYMAEADDQLGSDSHDIHFVHCEIANGIEIETKDVTILLKQSEKLALEGDCMIFDPLTSLSVDKCYQVTLQEYSTIVKEISCDESYSDRFETYHQRK